MTIEKNFVFFRDCNVIKESNDLLNYQAETLQLEVTGDAISFDIEVVGQLDSDNGEYSTCGVIDLSDLLVSQHIYKKGIYTCPIAGITKIKVKINSITGGKVSVFGRTLS